ncbi:MAG: haloacid dehalogenase type II [Paracoccaceae bacterium]
MAKELFVFDAYGTLFDLAGAVRAVALGDTQVAPLWPALAEEWRRKQLEYSWLRTIMGAHADFAQVTADALDWVLESRSLRVPGLRNALLAAAHAPPCYPEAPAALDALRARGMRLAILSNGTPRMLQAAVAASNLADRFEAVISVEAAAVYKPDPRVYALVEATTGVPPTRVAFVSANGWDVAGAARFGFATAWVNRTAAPLDRLPHGPARIISDLSQLGALA